MAFLGSKICSFALDPAAEAAVREQMDLICYLSRLRFAIGGRRRGENVVMRWREEGREKKGREE